MVHESGLLAVTIMGVVIANANLPSYEELRRFKEHATVLLVSGVFVLLFLGGWNPLPWVPLAPLIAGLPVVLGALIAVGIFLGKVFAFIFLFMWVRWTLPRFRYDQVMELGWKKLLPLAIGNLIFYTLAIAFIETR